jgi:putative ABC transport system substrate-binding protein
MRRREFIAVLSVAAALPLVGHGQQPEGDRRVGVLMPWSENDPLAQASVTAFAHGLERFGWVDGKNIRLDYRFAADDPALFKSNAAELVQLSPDAILASTPPAIVALHQQTATIPIVFVLAADPVGLGLVQSLARPGTNITGVGAIDPPIMGKWLQLLKEIAPSVTRVAVIFNPDTQPYAGLSSRAMDAAAASFRVTVTLAVRDDATIEETIATQARVPGGSLISLPDSFNTKHRDVIIAEAARHRLPLMVAGDAFPRAGGLISYWFNPVDLHAQAAYHIDRILKDANPAGDLHQTLREGTEERLQRC